MNSLSPGELARVDEPAAAEGYAAVLSQVAAAHRPVIVRRNGQDLAAVVPLEHLELIREGLAQGCVERETAKPVVKAHPKPGLPYVVCSPDAPARRMTASELLALEQETLAQEDRERLEAFRCNPPYAK